MTPIPEELKGIFAEFVRINKEKYGENWKEIVSKQITSDVEAAIKKDFPNAYPKTN